MKANVISTFFSALKVNVRLSLAGKAACQRLIGQPVARYIRDHGKNPDVSAEQFAEQVFAKGIAHPPTAIRVIKEISDKQITKRKLDVLNKVTVPNLKSCNRTFLSYKALPFILVLSASWILFNLFSIMKEDQKPGAQGKKKPYITLEVPPDEYRIDDANEWFKVVRDNCGTRQAYPEELLDTCLSPVIGGPIRGSGFHSYLITLEDVTVVIGQKEFDRQLELLELLKAAKSPEFESVSTAEAQDEVNVLSSSPIDFPIYANNYCRVYGFDIPELPAEYTDIEVIPVFDLINLQTTAPANNQPVLYRIIDTKVDPPVVEYVPADFTKIDYGLSVERLHGALGIAVGFKSEIEKAAAVLYALHPEIPEKVLRLMISRRAILFASSLRYEDPWQDIGLCEMVNCRYLDAFKKEFDGVKYGLRVGNQFVKPSWQLATKLHTPLAKQAFGPFSLLFGLSQEAAKADISKAYIDKLLVGYKLDDTSVMGNLLFDHPALVYGLQVHYVLSKLEQTLFKDPRMGLSPMFPPFVFDPAVARQMSLSAAVAILTCNPERDEIYKPLVTLDLHDFVFNALTADLLGEGPPFKNVVFRRMELKLSNGTKALTWLTFGNQRDTNSGEFKMREIVPPDNK